MIEYKTLNFVGYSHYKVDTLGNIYRFRFWKCGLNEEKCNNIKIKYSTNHLFYKNLAKEYNVSLPTIIRVIRTNKEDFWVKMKFRISKSGHHRIVLSNKDKHKQYQIHRLVLEAFVGPCPVGMEGCHNDGNPYNNHLLNLRWDTKSNNELDKIKHKTSNKGEKHSKAKLKDGDILMIRYLNKFLFQREIAKIYKVGKSTIQHIINRKNWKHI